MLFSISLGKLYQSMVIRIISVHSFTAKYSKYRRSDPASYFSGPTTFATSESVRDCSSGQWKEKKKTGETVESLWKYNIVKLTRNLLYLTTKTFLKRFISSEYPTVLCVYLNEPTFIGECLMIALLSLTPVNLIIATPSFNWCCAQNVFDGNFRQFRVLF